MSVDQIIQPITAALAQTDIVITGAMRSDIPLIREINQHISQGGKRIRPITSLLIAGLLGDITEQHILIAAVIEFVHTATLLHDDVVDQSTLRRGLATANQIWGNEASVLVGDFLYSRAFQLMTQFHDQGLMQILADASNVMAEGEVLQLMNKHNATLDQTTYDRIIHAKTAVLFQAACQMSAASSLANIETVRNMGEVGRHLGMAFQLVDDALDYHGDTQALGKNIGDDIAEGKLTLPLIYTLSVASGEDKAIINTAVTTGVSDLKQLITLIERYEATQYTLRIAQHHAQQAQQAIASFMDSPYKKSLLALIEFVVNRQN